MTVPIIAMMQQPLTDEFVELSLRVPPDEPYSPADVATEYRTAILAAIDANVLGIAEAQDEISKHLKYVLFHSEVAGNG